MKIKNHYYPKIVIIISLALALLSFLLLLGHHAAHLAAAQHAEKLLLFGERAVLGMYVVVVCSFFMTLVIARRWKGEMRLSQEKFELQASERNTELELINQNLEREIGEHRQAREELLKQNVFVKNTLESLTHPFYIIDADSYVIKMANSAAGFGPLNDRSTCYALTHDRLQPCDGVDHPCTIKEIKKTNRPATVIHAHKGHDGQGKTFEVHGYPIFDCNGKVVQVIEYAIDITERRQLEEQLQHSQKMECIGRLAGGVAHDFNNILTAIIGFSELAMAHLPPDHVVKKDLEIIKESGDKAAILVRQLLAFSRKQVLNMQVINLGELINGIVKMLNRVIGEDIILEINLREVRNIKADPSQVEQVFMNLVVNARDAMPLGGRICIELSDVELDEDYTRSHEGVLPGSYVMLAVTDTGKGMSRDLQEKIFEPYFTTKGTRGTGLGLATVYGIVRQQHGHIFVYSEPEIGTTFKVYLPATRESSSKEKVPQPVNNLGGTETILVVDDDASVRRLILDTLQPYGYNLIGATCAEEVLELLETTDQQIDLLLTDVIMPGMNGQSLAKVFRQKQPYGKVVFMSGYTDEIITNHGMLEQGEVFVEKPLSPLMLAGRLREILDE